MISEVQYSHEINALEKRFESWNETDQRDPSLGVRKPVSKLPSARDVVKNLPPEVAQFEVCIKRWHMQYNTDLTYSLR